MSENYDPTLADIFVVHTIVAEIGAIATSPPFGSLAWAAIIGSSIRSSHFERREAERAASTAPRAIRASDQPEDCQGARPRSAADATRPRRRGDRMSC